MINSVTNSQVKQVRRWQRDRRQRQADGVFVVEGSRWLADAAASAATIQALYCTEAWAAQAGSAALLATLDRPVTLVSDSVMTAMSDTQTPAGVLAVLTQPQWTQPSSARLYLILDAVRDPGNVGTMLRTAAAAGVDAVLLGPGCVDVYNPKVVRSSMGAHLRRPALALSWAEIGVWVQGMAVWLAAADGEQAYDQVDWQQPAALIIGSEAHGPGADAATVATGRVRIPMAAATESLNAAAAAAVILFHAGRQLPLTADGS